MKKTSLKTKLKSGELTIGSWISFGFNQSCEIMAKGRFDWLVIDMEHTVIDFNQCLNLIQIIESNGIAPIVRVGANNPLLIKRAMDAGSHGIIVPMVNTVEDAQKAIESLYYPPIGLRGVGLARAQNYGIGFEQYEEWANREIIFIPQIEHIEGVNNLENILALEHVDGFIIGPYDLSGSLGFPAKWDNSSVLEALDSVDNIVKENKKPGGFHIVHPNHDELQKKIDQGYSFIAYGDDMVFFAETVTAESHYLSTIKK